jgi:cytochrome oxidase Cu insertion factor (SCO1/SenC/PrrC family)
MQKSLKRILIVTWVLAGLLVCGVSAAAWLLRSGPVSRPIKTGLVGNSVESPRPVLQPLFDTPEFSLTDQNGKKFGRADLAGKVWIADFIFTHCTSMCPIMTQNMREIQTATTGVPVQLVSFTVDPEHDTPQVLKAYAAANKADETRWHFLTGDQKTMWELSVGMKLAVGPGDGAMQVMHSSRFLLVDGRGVVRGVYDYKDAGAIGNLLADTRVLIATEGK